MLAALVAGVCASAVACGKSSPCERVASARDLCGNGQTCTWAAVQTNHAYCNACASDPFSTGTCGGYLVLSHVGPDWWGQAFYDATSGDLVATVGYSQGLMDGCRVVGSVAFTPPVGCSPGTAPDPPQWCSPDAGAATEQVFPCCRDALDTCVRVGECPPTWADVPAATARWCDAHDGWNRSPEVGECGGYHVLRYQPSVGVLLTVYYDATTNAPVGAVDSKGLCRYGSVEGVTLPACNPTFVSQCPGGAADAGGDGP